MNAIIIGYTSTSEGVWLETNVPVRLLPDRMLSKTTFVSWDKIGQLLFDNYSDDPIRLRNTIVNSGIPIEGTVNKTCPHPKEYLHLLSNHDWHCMLCNQKI